MFYSENATKAFYQDILTHFDLPDLTPEQTTFVLMHPFEEAAAYLLKNPKLVAAAQEYREQMDYFKFIGYLEIDPQLKPALKWIRKRYQTAIATNRAETIGLVLEEFDLVDEFDLVISVLDVNKPKPNPEPLIKILTHFNIEPQEAVYVGDSKVDEMAANDAKIPFVAFQNPSLSAAFHIQSHEELKDIL
jgi:HAD superfamily hydrolase (TIGR01509 family)